MHSLAMLFGNAGLVLREKVIHPDGPCYIRLVGRRSGLISFLLTLLGIDTTTTFEVYDDRIEYTRFSLSGKTQELIPLAKVSNLLGGYFKPVMLLFFSFLSLVLGVIAWGALKEDLGNLPVIFGILLFAVFMIGYFLKKSIVVGVVPNSASPVTVAFRRSVIENKNLSEAEARQILDILNVLVSRANR